MAIAFPSSPAVNDTHPHNERWWIWTGHGWKEWTNFGQCVSVFKPMTTAVSITELPYSDPTNFGWVTVNYV